jgi:hypothetical protein
VSQFDNTACFLNATVRSIEIQAVEAQHRKIWAPPKKVNKIICPRKVGVGVKPLKI